MSNIVFADLRAEMARKNILISDLARSVGVNRDTMGKKLSGQSPIKLDEAFLITRNFFPDKTVWELFKELDDTNQTTN